MPPKITYIDGGNELNRLSILAKLFALDVLEDGHTFATHEF